jgi:DNA-binding transcriptional LysR family regulator
MIGRLSDIDLRLLRIFVSVVDAGGFSLATAKLNVAESTISQHMTDLEKRLGMRLCERGRAGFRLTADGEQVYKATIDLLTEVERYRGRLASIRSDMSGTIRIGLPDAIITDENSLIVATLKLYLEQNPDVSLDVEMLTPRDLERQVIEGRIHLAVAPEHRRVAGLEYEPLYVERNSLYCGRESPLFPLPDRDITDAMIETAERIARGYLDQFDAEFFSSTNYRATVHQIEAAALLILTGTCVGFLPDHYASAFVSRGEMRSIRPERFSFESALGVITRRDGTADPRIERLVRMLKAGRTR